MKKVAPFGRSYCYTIYLFAFISLFLLPLGSCRKFDLHSRFTPPSSNLPPTFRFDITLDDAYLTAYNGRFSHIVSTSSTSSCTKPSKAENDRVMSGHKILVLYRISSGSSQMARINVVDTFRSQLLVRSDIFQFPIENRGDVLTIQKIILLDKNDSTIMVAPLQNTTAEKKILDSLVDPVFRLPILTNIPLVDSGVNIIPIHMTFAGKGLNDNPKSDSLGYTDSELKKPTFLSPPTTTQ